MFKSGREKAILKQGALIIGIMAGLYIFVLSPFLKEGSSILDEELERKTDEIKRYISRTGSMPSKESFDKLEEERLAMEEKLEGLVDFIDPVKVRIQDTGSQAGFYFRERLHSSIKEFLEEDNLKDAVLPENLGFGEALPKDDMVDTLLRQLETVELVIGVLSGTEGIAFTAIKPLKSIDYVESLSKEILYTEVPVQISMKTKSNDLVDLLLKLNNARPVVSVKEVHIKSGESDNESLEASLVLSTFIVK